MIVVVGEVLFDLFPNEKRIGGAPFNFAFHLTQLGFPVKLVTRVGDDPDGWEIIDIMKRFGLAVDGVQIDPDHVTGNVQVTLDETGNPDYYITREVAYDYLAFTDQLREWLAVPPDLLYFGTLIQRDEQGRETVGKILETQNPQTRFFYDVNLRPDCYDRDIIQTSLRHTDILKLNDAELRTIADLLGYAADAAAPVDQTIDRMMKEFNIAVVAVTKGAAGSELYTRQGTFDITPNVSTADTCVSAVGAGDAFAAVMAAGHLRGFPPDAILKIATDFAGKICGLAGAVPDDQGFYKTIRRLVGGNKT